MKQKLNWKTLAIDLGYDIIGSILFAIGLYTFALNAQFAPGGVSGLAMITNYLVKLPIGTATILINIPIILLSVKIMGKTFLLKSIKTMIINAIFLDYVIPLFPIYQGDPFMACIFTGVFVGAACAILYMRGTSTGGVDFLILSLKKMFPFLTVGQITLIIDGVIVVLGGFVFKNVDAVLFGIIEIVASTIVLDRIMAGSGSGKLAIIITDNGMAAAKTISDEIDRGSTLVKSIGTYTGMERDMLICACNNVQLHRLRDLVHSMDSNAMIMVTDATDLYGEGFLAPETEQ